MASDNFPQQLTLGFAHYEPPIQLRLSEHTRRLGLKHIARIKAQIAEQKSHEEETGHAA